uniref:RNA helicase n=1 Tax=Globodera rostochiensis TaxID=31243 RepID=A0A914HSD3_GLORO
MDGELMSSAEQELAALAVINGLDPDQVFGSERVESEVVEPSVAENLSKSGDEAEEVYESCGEREEVESGGEEMEEEKMEEEKEDESENEGELNSKGRVYVVVQVQRYQAIIAPVGGRRVPWPHFVSVRDDLPSARTERPLQIGDLLELKQYDWREGFSFLLNVEDGADITAWLNNGQIKAQAVAKEVSLMELKLAQPAVGIVLEVNYGVGGKVKSLTVMSALLRMRQRMYPRQFVGGFDESWAVTGMVVLLDIVQLNRPADWKVGMGYTLPKSSPFGTGDERSAHRPAVAVGIRPSPIRHEFPFRAEHGNELVKQGEEVMATGMAACSDKQESELNRFTVTVTPSTVDDQNETATFEIQCHWERKEELVDMCKVWRQDQPISMALVGPDDAKPCGHGFVSMVRREELQFGYVLVAQIFVVFQEIKNYNSWEDWELIKEGNSQVRIKPLQSLEVFQRRIDLLLQHQPSEMAADESARGQIVASILARTEARAEPELTWEELADRPELSRMIEGQRETARLMLDPIPRICKQMAPPGTGKTDVATRIMLAILRENLEARVLYVAPMNVAVVRAVQQMAENMEEIGWREPMLALFAGSGKAKYREEIAHIGDHLLASAVRAPHLLDGLDVQKKRVVQRYLTACESSPRTANEGKVAGILMGKEKRRLIFSTLSLAEQIGGLLSEFEVIILDEAGQASSVQVLSMLTNFPALKKLLVTGDDHQLGVNLQEVRNFD